jgi:hypothetical protein
MLGRREHSHPPCRREHSHPPCRGSRLAPSVQRCCAWRLQTRTLRAALLLGALGLVTSFSAPAGLPRSCSVGRVGRVGLRPSHPRTNMVQRVGRVGRVGLRPSHPRTNMVQREAEPFEPGEAARGLSRPGGGSGRYTWSQDARQVLVTVPCPSGTSSKDVNIDIKPSKLRLSVQGTAVFDDEPLAFKIKPDDSFWSLDEDSTGKFIKLELEKMKRYQQWEYLGA